MQLQNVFLSVGRVDETIQVAEIASHGTFAKFSDYIQQESLVAVMRLTSKIRHNDNEVFYSLQSFQMTALKVRKKWSDFFNQNKNVEILSISREGNHTVKHAKLGLFYIPSHPMCDLSLEAPAALDVSAFLHGT